MVNLCKWGVLDRRPPACARSTAIICLLVYAESRDVKVAANFTRRCTATKRSRGREMKDRSSLKFRGTRTTSANLLSPPVYKVAPASFSITIKLPPHSLSKGRSARPLSPGLAQGAFQDGFTVGFKGESRDGRPCHTRLLLFALHIKSAGTCTGSIGCREHEYKRQPISLH